MQNFLQHSLACCKYALITAFNTWFNLYIQELSIDGISALLRLPPAPNRGRVLYHFAHLEQQCLHSTFAKHEVCG